MPSQKEAFETLDQASKATVVDFGAGMNTVPASSDRRGVIVSCLTGICYVQFGGTSNQLTASTYAAKLTGGDVYELMWYSGVLYVLGENPSATRVTLLED